MSTPPDELSEFEIYPEEDDSLEYETSFEDDLSQFEVYAEDQAKPLLQTATPETAEDITSVPGLTIGETPSPEYRKLPTLEERLRDPVAIAAAKAEPNQVLGKNFLTSTRDVREKIFTQANLTYEALESQQAKPIFLRLSKMLKDTDSENFLEKYPSALYVLKTEKSLFATHAVRSLKYLNLLYNNDALPTEERRQAYEMHNRILDVIQRKANEIQAGFDPARQNLQTGTSGIAQQPIPTIGKDYSSLDDLTTGVMRVIDMIDVPDRLAFAAVTDADYQDALPEQRVDYIRNLAKANLTPVSPASKSKGYSMRNPIASMFMFASDVLGKGSATALTGAFGSLKLLADMAIEQDAESMARRLPSGRMAAEFAPVRDPEKAAPKRKKADIDYHRHLTEAMTMYSIAEKGMTDVALLVLTAPTTYVTGGLAGVPKVLNQVEEIIKLGYKGKGMAKARPFTDQEKIELIQKTKDAMEEGYKARSSFVTDAESLGTVNSHTFSDKIVNENISKGIKRDIDFAKIQLEEALKAQQRNVFGSRQKVKRAQAELDRLNALYNDKVTEGQKLKANSQAYLDFEDAAFGTIRYPKSGSVLTEGLGVTPLKTDEGVELFSDVYRDIAKYATDNGVDIKDLDTYFGKGGEFLGKSELSFMGKPIRIPGTGPYFFHRAMRKLAPKFEKFPKVKRALAQSGSQFKNIRRTGVTMFDEEGGILQRRARARKELLKKDATNAAVDLFSRGSLRLVANDGFQDHLLTRVLDANFTYHEADGLMFDRLKFLEDIPAPVRGRGDPEFSSVAITQERQMDLLEPLVTRFEPAREGGKTVLKKVQELAPPPPRVQVPPGIRPAPESLLQFPRLKRDKAIDLSITKIPGIGPKKRKALLAEFNSYENVSNATYYELGRVKELSQKDKLSILYHYNYNPDTSIYNIDIRKIPGIGAAVQKRLVNELGGPTKVADASLEEIAAVKGVGKNKAQKIFDHFTDIKAAMYAVYSDKTDLTNYKSWLDIITDETDPVQILAIGTREADTLKGAKPGMAGPESVEILRRDSSMDEAIDALVSRDARLREIKKADTENKTYLLNDESIFVSLKSSNVVPGGASLPARTFRVKIGDLTRIKYRNVEFEDLGQAWNAKGPAGQYINRRWLEDMGLEEPMFVEHLSPVIAQREGQSYFVRHMPSAEDNLYRLTEEEGVWAKGFYQFMESFRDEFAQSRLFTGEDSTFNPITGFYVHRDYAKRSFSDVIETVLPDNTFSAKDSSSIMKARTGPFGVPLGDKEKLSQEGYKISGAAKIDPDLDIPRVTTNYIRKASNKLAEHDLTEAYARLYGLPKSKFMQTFKETYDGRGSPVIITDPLVGTSMTFKQNANKMEALVKLEDDVLFNVNTKPNETWNKILREARDEAGNPKKESRYFIYDGVDDQYVFTADIANEIKAFRDTDSYFSNALSRLGKDTQLDWAIQATLFASRSADRAVKRGILMSRPAYFGINMLTDTMMLQARIPNITLDDFKTAMTLLDDPTKVKIKVEGLDLTIPGQRALAAGRKEGLMTSSIERLEDLSGAVNPTTRLRIAALRGSGQPFTFNGSKNEIYLQLLNQQQKIADFGLRAGENFTAWWQDLHQAAGYIAALRSGSSFTESATRVFKATLDYGDRTKGLNTVRVLAPFATWAVKAPKSTLTAFALRPRAFTIPIRIREELENITIEQEGANYFLPKWMRDQANYVRTPRIFAPYINIAEKLMGGKGISEDEQLFVKTRMVPLIEALQPFFTSLSYLIEGDAAGGVNPFVAQINPGLKAIYEFITNINTQTGEPYALEAQLSRPFAAQVPFPRKYFLFGGPIPRPAALDAGFTPLGYQAQTPDQLAYFSQHLLPYLGALPEVFPGQRFAVSSMGLKLANVAQFYGRGEQTMPFVYGQTRDFQGPERGRTQLSRSVTGDITGFAPAYVKPQSELLSLQRQIKSGRYDFQDRETVLKQVDTASKKLQKAINAAVKELVKKQKKNKSGNQ